MQLPKEQFDPNDEETYAAFDSRSVLVFPVVHGGEVRVTAALLHSQADTVSHLMVKRCI